MLLPKWPSATAIPPQCVQTPLTLILALSTCWPPAKCHMDSYNFDFVQQEDPPEEEEEKDLQTCTVQLLQMCQGC